MQQPPYDPNQQYQQQPGGPPPPAGYPAPDQSGYLGQPGYAGVGAPTAMLHNDDPMEDLVRKQEARNKAISLGISAGIVALLFAVLAWWTITAFTEEKIELVVAATQGSQDAVVEKKQFQQSVRQKPSRPSSSPSNTISAAKASPIAVPSVETDLQSPDLGTSFGTGFGGGGFGDGLGGGMGVPSVMKGRCDTADRKQRLVKAKGSPGMDKTVLKALRWLKEKQQDNGSWGKKFPISMTAFALLCYSGHCETVDSPEFGETVKKAIEYLVTEGEKGKGLMASTKDRNISYEHAIAVYSLAEAYSMNKNARKPFKRISPILKKGVPIIIEGQTNGGGWLYSYGSNGTGDLSVAGWNIQALKAAEFTGIKFSGLTTAKKKALKYLGVAEDPKGTAGFFKYRIRPSDKGKLSLTGVGLLCSRMLGKPSKLEDKGLELILDKKPKGWTNVDTYAWYYHSQAAFQTGVNSKYWRDYSKSYQDVVYKAQENDGSWKPAGNNHMTQLGPDGDIYITCLCTLMMEVYYRYLPTIDKK